MRAKISSESTTTNDSSSSSTHRFTADSRGSDSSDSPNSEPIMSAPEAKPCESKTLDESSQPPDPPAEAKSVDEEPQKPLEDPNSSEKVSDNGGESKDGHDEDDDDEEGECGFCLFMKGGGCKESFVSWEKCIEEAEKNKEDIVEKCFEVTGALKKCMEAHSDYYEPVLRAEKAAEAEAVKELEKEAAAAAPEDNAAAQKQVLSSD